MTSLYSYNHSPNSTPIKNCKSPKLRDSYSLRGSFSELDNKLSSSRTCRMLASCPGSPNIKKSITTNNQKQFNDFIYPQKPVKIPGLKIVSIKSTINVKPILPIKKTHHKFQSFDSSINSQMKRINTKQTECSFDRSLEFDALKSSMEQNSIVHTYYPIKPVVPLKHNAFIKKNIYDKTIDLELCTDIADALASDEIDKVSHLPHNDKEAFEINIQQISLREPKNELFNDILSLPINLTERKDSPLKIGVNSVRTQQSEKKYYQELKFQNKLYNYILDNPISSTENKA